jgi:hypothetical protein
MRELVLDEELAQLYAAALYTISRADDGAVDRDENTGLRTVIEQRWQLALDPEALFFTTVTPESFATAVSVRDPFRGSAAGERRQIARALIADAVTLSTLSGGLDDRKAHAILRFAHALGCSSDEILAASPRLAEWID